MFTASAPSWHRPRSTPTSPRRPPTRHRSSGPRTASSGRAPISASTNSTRRGHERGEHRERLLRRWGSAFKITQSDPSADSGHLTIFYKADAAHAAFDNIAFLSDDQVTFVQDQGEGLHGVEGFDSGFVFDVNKDYSDSANQPVRWLAQGRDPSATLDAANGGFGKNDQDNEITGTTVSNGDPRPGGILGAKIPHLFKDGWRFFYTQQHGDNPTYEVIPSSWTHGEPDD